MMIGSDIMTVLSWYLTISLFLGIGWLLYFAGHDLYSWYKNKRGYDFPYYFADDLCQVVIITLSWSIPVVNIATLIMLIAVVTNSHKKG